MLENTSKDIGVVGQNNALWVSHELKNKFGRTYPDELFMLLSSFLRLIPSWIKSKWITYNSSNRSLLSHYWRAPSRSWKINVQKKTKQKNFCCALRCLSPRLFWAFTTREKVSCELYWKHLSYLSLPITPKLPALANSKGTIFHHNVCLHVT